MLTFFPGLVLQPMKCDGCRLEYFQVSSFKPKKQDGKKVRPSLGLEKLGLGQQTKRFGMAAIIIIFLRFAIEQVGEIHCDVHIYIHVYIHTYIHTYIIVFS
jgi:hypothetical protein